MSDEPAIKAGDTVFLSMVDGSVISGELIKVMSDEGQTDGLLKIQEPGVEWPSFVYERHILVTRRIK